MRWPKATTCERTASAWTVWLMVCCGSLLACGDDASDPTAAERMDPTPGVMASDMEPEPGKGLGAMSGVQSPGWVGDGVVDSRAMAAWMRGGYYRRWDASEGVAPSAEGPSRVYLSDALSRSLREGATSHPIGAVGVREIYEEDFLTLKAVNVLVKMDDDDAEDGSSWLWVELVDLEPGGEPSVEEAGAPRCVACHVAAGGADFIQSAWPLR